MNFVENWLLLTSLPLGIILAGYWLAAGLASSSAAERVAVATLAGLSALLWNVTVINFYHPLSGGWAWLCLWPIALTFATRNNRRSLRHDAVALVTHFRGVLVAVLTGIFLFGLLWPLFTHSSLIFYDATSNHDSFFWVTAAEYLKRFSYMEIPGRDALHPANNNVAVITGWRPVWGRMGAEGLLGLASTLFGVSVVKIYVCATAALFIPWLAAVYLTTRTFISERLDIATLAAIVLFEPIFVFLQGNANLPNLIGILTGAAVVVATERGLREKTHTLAWLGLLALATQGLICSYPEMLPFILLPGGILWMRRWIAYGIREAWRPCLGVALAYIVGSLLNPASSYRAYYGFIESFGIARADHNWANLFQSLTVAQYLPALTTLSIQASFDIGIFWGGLLSLTMMVAIVFVIRRGRDPFGAVAMLSGTLILLAYTFITGFNYGCQKAVEFGGVFCATLLPATIGELRLFAQQSDRVRRWIVRLALFGIAAFSLYAMVRADRDDNKFAGRKRITSDFFALRDYSREHLLNAPVLIDGSSFRMSFFHGMWLTYFLPNSSVYFAGRGQQNAGYLRDSVINENTGKVPPVKAFVVDHDWAESFDANSSKLFSGETVALLSNSNRVIEWTGLSPDNGVPNLAGRHITLSLIPHNQSQIRFSLFRGRRDPNRAVRWRVNYQTEEGKPFAAEVSGLSPWLFAIPLVAQKINRIEITALPDRDDEEKIFGLRDLKVVTLP